MDSKVLARVNGREITEYDLVQTVTRFPRERQEYFVTEQGRKELLDQVVSFELVYNFAKDNALDAEQPFKEQMANVEKEVLTQYAVNRVLSQVDVTEKEVKDFYQNNMSMFIEEESVRAKHVLVENLEEANKVLKEIKSGLSFEDAAQKYSNCPSKAQGGELGTFSRGRMVPEFEKAAFELEVGVISEPVETQFGYHLIKVEEKIAPNLKPLKEVENVIGNNLMQQKQNQTYSEFTNFLKSKYNVEYTNQ
jgi:peptidyl-prolyl cis-trans isomerase C